MTMHLSRTYKVHGAFISHYDTVRYLANPAIEISVDGTNWTAVWSDDAYYWRNEATPREKGYITWNCPAGTDLTANWVRLSWGANNNPVEIVEFQLFGQ